MAWDFLKWQHKETAENVKNITSVSRGLQWLGIWSTWLKSPEAEAIEFVQPRGKKAESGDLTSVLTRDWVV